MVKTCFTILLWCQDYFGGGCDEDEDDDELSEEEECWELVSE